MSLDDREYYRKEIARREAMRRRGLTHGQMKRYAGIAGVVMVLASVAFAPAIGQWLQSIRDGDALGRTMSELRRIQAGAVAPVQQQQRQVCISLATGRVFCRPAIDAVLIGPSLTCLRVGTGMVCPPAPQFAYDRRMPDAVDGKNGAPDPAHLFMQWGLCNDAGQWHDTPGCNRTFPDVRHPRPIE